LKQKLHVILKKTKKILFLDKNVKSYENIRHNIKKVLKSEIKKFKIVNFDELISNNETISKIINNYYNTEKFEFNKEVTKIEKNLWWVACCCIFANNR